MEPPPPLDPPPALPPEEPPREPPPTLPPEEPPEEPPLQLPPEEPEERGVVLGAGLDGLDGLEEGVLEGLLGRGAGAVVELGLLVEGLVEGRAAGAEDVGLVLGVDALLLGRELPLSTVVAPEELGRELPRSTVTAPGELGRDVGVPRSTDVGLVAPDSFVETALEAGLAGASTLGLVKVEPSTMRPDSIGLFVLTTSLPDGTIRLVPFSVPFDCICSVGRPFDAIGEAFPLPIPILPGF